MEVLIIHPSDIKSGEYEDITTANKDVTFTVIPTNDSMTKLSDIVNAEDYDLVMCMFESKKNKDTEEYVLFVSFIDNLISKVIRTFTKKMILVCDDEPDELIDQMMTFDSTITKKEQVQEVLTDFLSRL